MVKCTLGPFLLARSHMCSQLTTKLCYPVDELTKYVRNTIKKLSVFNSYVAIYITVLMLNTNHFLVESVDNNMRVVL